MIRSYKLVGPNEPLKGPNEQFQRRELLFPPYGILARPIFFFKNALDVSGFHNPEWCFPLLKGEKISYEFFRIS